MSSEMWFEEFWLKFEELGDDDAIPASDLLAKMFSHGLLRRDGDLLFGLGNSSAMVLSASEQFLVRRTQEAVDKADSNYGPFCGNGKNV